MMDGRGPGMGLGGGNMGLPPPPPPPLPQGSAPQWVKRCQVADRFRCATVAFKPYTWVSENQFAAHVFLLCYVYSSFLTECNIRCKLSTFDYFLQMGEKRSGKILVILNFASIYVVLSYTLRLFSSFIQGVMQILETCLLSLLEEMCKILSPSCFPSSFNCFYLFLGWNDELLV